MKIDKAISYIQGYVIGINSNGDKQIDVALDRIEELIEKLDDLDKDDYFGTEGWKHHLPGEDS